MKKLAKLVVGNVAQIIAPQLARSLDKPSTSTPAARLKRAIFEAKLHSANRARDTKQVEELLSTYWVGEAGDRFHKRYSDERFALFRSQHHDVVDALKKLSEEFDFANFRLVEIGCGDGRVLAHVSKQLPPMRTVIGIDINASVIETNKTHYIDQPKLSFVCADALDWLRANPWPGTIVLTNGGVFEYFSESKLDALFETLSLQKPAVVALIEPVASDHNFETETSSKTFGRENSFSHNYRKRLETRGFNVIHERETTILQERGCTMIAVAR